MDAIDRPDHRPRCDRSLLRACLFALALCAASQARAQAGAQAGVDTLNLFWTAPGDDGVTGIAADYDLRYSTSPITSQNFVIAVPVPTSAPSAPSTREHVVARGLTRGTDYWFALRTRDEAGNWSGLSNVLHWQWALDRSPPATPQNVVADIQRDGKEIHLSWRPGTEPDLAGYNLFRAADLPGPYVRQNPGLLTAAAYVDASLPSNDADLWYEVASVDQDGNESPRTAPIRVSRSSASASITAWKLKPAYPNPAHVGELQRLPIELPAGAGLAVIEILDSAGQRVRRLQVPLAGPGFGQLTWDGRNDAGALVAPGLYRASLETGGERQFTRLVRTP